MPRSYRASNGRIIPRRSGGQFRKTTLRDFGISQSELSDGTMICAGCGYGEKEYWRPVLKTGYCPKCGSQEKKSAQHNAHLTPETLATPQAVSNASAVLQSDSDTTPAQAQVA